MPVKSCSVKGNPGKKYGNSGKCYTGKGASAKAGKQGAAIKASQAAKGKKK